VVTRAAPFDRHAGGDPAVEAAREVGRPREAQIPQRRGEARAVAIGADEDDPPLAIREPFIRMARGAIQTP
jgi:hypothetical protein